MRKSKSLISLAIASVFLFSGCEFLSLVLGEEESNQNSKGKTTQIYVDEKDNGKECYIIYYNKNNSDGYLGGNQTITVNNSENKNRATAGTKNGMTIYKGVFNMGNGLYRDDVHFSFEKPKEGNVSRSASARSAVYRDLTDKSFYVAIKQNTTSSDDFQRKEFTLKAEGDYCRIWYLNNNPSLVTDSIVTTSELKKLADTVDIIFEDETAIFGSNHISGKSGLITADENTKIDVLVYDLFSDAYEGQMSGTFGFFNPNELYSNYDKSNKCEAIHLDSYFLQYDIKGTKNDMGVLERTHVIDSTIIHEFQHLLDYCNKKDTPETWYNEMLSLCAEDIFQNVLGISDYDSPKSRLDGNFDTPWQGFKKWPESSSSDVLNAYANVYAFGAYLMRNYGGVKLINEIATNISINEVSITNALTILGYQEDFYSVFEKFGRVYITNEKNKVSLNNTTSQTFKSVEYKLDSIDLKKYYFHIYDSEDSITNDVRNNLKSDGYYINGIKDFKSVYALLGPRVFKTNYYFHEAIQPYGFVVYYLGKLDSSKAYTVKAPGANIEISKVIID